MNRELSPRRTAIATCLLALAAALPAAQPATGDVRLVAAVDSTRPAVMVLAAEAPADARRVVFSIDRRRWVDRAPPWRFGRTGRLYAGALHPGPHRLSAAVVLRSGRVQRLEQEVRTGRGPGQWSDTWLPDAPGEAVAGLHAGAPAVESAMVGPVVTTPKVVSLPGTSAPATPAGDPEQPDALLPPPGLPAEPEAEEPMVGPLPEVEPPAEPEHPPEPAPQLTPTPEPPPPPAPEEPPVSLTDPEPDPEAEPDPAPVPDPDPGPGPEPEPTPQPGLEPIPQAEPPADEPVSESEGPMVGPISDQAPPEPAEAEAEPEPPAQVSSPSPSHSTPAFLDAGFENILGSWNTAGVGDVVPEVVADIVRTGEMAARVALDGPEERSELILGGPRYKHTVRLHEGTERFYAFSFYVVSMAYGRPGAHNLIMQLKSSNEGSPRFGLMLWNYGGGNSGGRGLWTHGDAMGGDHFLVPIEHGRWYDVAIHFRVSGKGHGFYRLFVNGTLVHSRAEISLLRPEAEYGYLKNGIYRNPETIPGPSEIRLDAATLGSTMQEVDPG